MIEASETCETWVNDHHIPENLLYFLGVPVACERLTILSLLVEWPWVCCSLRLKLLSPDGCCSNRAFVWSSLSILVGTTATSSTMSSHFSSWRVVCCLKRPVFSCFISIFDCSGLSSVFCNFSDSQCFIGGSASGSAGWLVHPKVHHLVGHQVTDGCAPLLDGPLGDEVLWSDDKRLVGGLEHEWIMTFHILEMS